MLEDLYKEYDKLQQKYGDKSLHSIYNGGCIDNPDIMFIFMNPTGKNIASLPEWKGIHAPWIGTKNVWPLLNKIGLLDDSLASQIKNKKAIEWDEKFAQAVYDDITNHKIFITNLAKCTQFDARPLPDTVFKKYLNLMLKEIDIIKPKIIVTFGNQVSSIILNQKISVSQCRKKKYVLKVNKKEYDVYPVYYPVGNGIFNQDKAIEDLLYIRSVACEKIL